LELGYGGEKIVSRNCRVEDGFLFQLKWRGRERVAKLDDGGEEVYTLMQKCQLLQLIDNKQKKNIPSIGQGRAS
jgi:hypothetical protein